MNLFLNSPSHYTQEFGVIDEVYLMCKYISENIDIKNYTASLDSIGVVPMVAPFEIISETGWKEIKYVSTRFRMADIALCSDYELFCNADLNEKKKIILKNILDSLKVIKKKLKGEFDYDQMEKDILFFCEKFDENNTWSEVKSMDTV